MLVIIGIPVYKEILTDLEKISLRQVDNIMSQWKKVFIAPESLHINYGESYDGYEVVRFSDKFFQNKESYSDLLLTEEFYENFLQYKFLLIYQLDAFVFSDRLKEFCDFNVDYIGAPARARYGNWSNYHVGNGGFSLRNVRSCLSVVANKDEIISQMVSQCHPVDWGEDDFFAFCGVADNIMFHVPSSRLAATFSVQSDYAHGLRRISREGLPFGCHYWHNMNYYFWKPYIESYGHVLPDIEKKIMYDSLYLDHAVRSLYLSKRYIREKYKRGQFDQINRFLDQQKKYCLWGAGRWGARALRFFQSLPVKYCIHRIYDVQPSEFSMCNLPVERPDEKKIKRRNEIILITSLKYMEDIRECLLSMGLVENKKFFSFFNLGLNLKNILLCDDK